MCTPRFVLIFLMVSATSLAQIPTNGLVAYYPFNGNAADESGYGNHGTIHGATPSTDRFGNPNKAYLFNGTSNYIECGLMTNINSQFTNEITVSAWVFFENVSGNQFVAGKWGTGGKSAVSYYIGKDAANRVIFNVDWDAATEAKAVYPFVTGRWYHLLGKANASGVYVYVDGSQVAASPSGISYVNVGSQPFRIGYETSAASSYFNGKIDDVRLYSRSLIQSEILALANETASTVPTGGLVAWYPFNGNAADESGNGWHGTVNGAILTNDRLGRTGKAYEFNSGAAQTIDTQYPCILGSAERSFSFWQTSDNTTASQTMSYGAGASHPSVPGCTFLISVIRANATQIGVGIDLRHGGVQYLVDDIGSGWHHYCVVVPAMAQPRTRDVKVYRDGTLLTNEGSMWGDVPVNTLAGANLRFGQFINSANFGAKLDDIRIYNRALSTAEIQALSNEGSGTTNPMAAPNLLEATARSHAEVFLRWSDNATAEDNYEVERRLVGGNWQKIATLPANSSEHLDNTGLQATTIYQYQVRATKGTTFSAYSNIRTVTTLKQVAGSMTFKVRDSVTKNPIEGATVYLLDAQYAVKQTPLETGTTGPDGSITLPTPPRVIMAAENYAIRVEKSGFDTHLPVYMFGSALVQTQFVDLKPRIIAPKWVGIEDECKGTGSVLFTWSHSAPQAITGFLIEIGENGKNWRPLVTAIGPGETMRSVQAIPAGKHDYRIFALRGTLRSSAPVLTHDHLPVPPQPKDFQLSWDYTKPDEVIVSWPVPPTGICSVKVEYYNNAVTKWIEIYKGIANTSLSTIFQDQTITKDRWYYFRLSFGNDLHWSKPLEKILSTYKYTYDVDVEVKMGNSSQTIPGATVRVYGSKNGPDAGKLIRTGTSDPNGKILFRGIPDNAEFEAEKIVFSKPGWRNPSSARNLYSIYADSRILVSMPNGSFEYARKPFTAAIDGGLITLSLAQPIIRYNLCVFVQRDLSTVMGSYLPRLNSSFNEVSKQLFELSDGQIQIDSVFVFDKQDPPRTNGNAQKCDIYLFETGKLPTGWRVQGDLGGAYQSKPLFGLSGLSDGQIWISEEIPDLPSSNVSSASSWNSVMYGSAVAHEICHYALELDDEYDNILNSIQKIIHQCPSNIYPELGAMEHYGKRYLSNKSHYPDMSTINNACYTSQWHRYKQPCWGTLSALLSRLLAQVPGNSTAPWLKFSVPVNPLTTPPYAPGRATIHRVGPAHNHTIVFKYEGRSPFSPDEISQNLVRRNNSPTEFRNKSLSKPFSNSGLVLDAGIHRMNDTIMLTFHNENSSANRTIVSAYLEGSGVTCNASIKNEISHVSMLFAIPISEYTLYGQGSMSCISSIDGGTDTTHVHYTIGFLPTMSPSVTYTIAPDGEHGTQYIVRDIISNQYVLQYDQFTLAEVNDSLIQLSYPTAFRLEKDAILSFSCRIVLPIRRTLLGIDMTTLAIHRYDSTSGSWVRLADSYMYPGGQQITATSDRTGIFCVFAPGFSSDATPPAAVDDATAATDSIPGGVRYSFTAPGDDDLSGTAYIYEVRYATEPIDEDTWASAIPLPVYTRPAAAGTVEQLTFTMPQPGVTYHFAMKTTDESGNVSALSNGAAAESGLIRTGNHRPSLLASPRSRTLQELQPYAEVVIAEDRDGDALSMSGHRLPPGARIDSTGYNEWTLRWTPTVSQAGVYPNISIVVTDGVDADSASFMLTVTDVNQRPVFAVASSDTTISEMQHLSLAVRAHDPEGAALTYRAPTIPSGATYDAATSTFEWTPSYEQAGPYTGIRIIASDGAAEDTATLSITVLNVNRAPSSFSLIAPVEKDTVQPKQTPISIVFSWQPSTDPDKDPVRYRFLLRDPLSVMLRDTVVLLPSVTVTDVFQEQNRYTWSVTASDGADSTTATSFFHTGRDSTTSVDRDVAQANTVFLEQNHPNPFSSSTTVVYRTASAHMVSIFVYDLLGRNVATLFDGESSPGSHAVFFHRGSLPAGNYVIRLESDGRTSTRLMSILQ
ncbi:MAG: T9SS type A sorting domain-containing protein [Ignavibacteriae bacterium]|nr:T9SS type A sorting domain-containing protein [Ignavibacteriota bacterium]